MYQICKFILLISILGSSKFVRVKCIDCNGVEPLCVDKNKVLVKSKCENGTWSPAEHCEMVQRSFQPKCLHGDDLFRSYCIHIRKPSSWKQDTLPVYDVEILNLYNIYNIILPYLKETNSSISSFWLPAKRLEDYGKISWTIPKYYHSNFQLQLNESVPDLLSLVTHDCVLFSTETNMKIEDCKKKYHSIHIYKPESRYYTRTISWYYSTNNTNGYYIANKCKYLAEPKTEEENFIIKSLVGNIGLECRIGVERNKAGTFVWSASKIPVNFTDWLPYTNFDYTIVVATADGWTLRPYNSNVNFSICQVDYSKYKIDMSLSLNENETLMLLTQYSSHRIKATALRTVGLEDINLKPILTEIEDYNNYKGTENVFEKSNRRMSWYVDVPFSLSNSNEYYYDYILLPEAKELTTTKIFLPRKNNLLKFSFKAKIKRICFEVVCDPNINFNLYKNISYTITEELFSRYNQNVTVIKILKIYKDGDIKILLHLHTNIVQDENTNKYYEEIKNSLQIKNLKYTKYDLSLDDGSLKLLTSCLYKETKENNCIFKWEITNIGNTYTAKCTNFLHGNLDNMSKQSQFAYKKCEGNFVDGAEWGKTRYLSSSNETAQIMEVFYKLANVSASVAVKELSNVISMSSDIHPSSMHFISAIFKNVSHSTVEITDMETLAKSTSSIVNNILASNILLEDQSDIVEDSANDMLQNIEELFPQITKNKINANGTHVIIEDNFIHVMINPFILGISGIALIKPNITNPSFKNYEIQFLHTDTSIEQIMEKENLEVATFVPYILFNHIKSYSNEQARISVNIFYNDTLFLPSKTINETINKPHTKIIDVSILNYSRILFSELPIIAKTNATICGYWDFGTKIEKKRKWKNDDLASSHGNAKDIQICNFSHLTNFAMLIGKQVIISTSENSAPESNTGLLNSEENRNLQIITALGFILSVFGINVIYLTAFMFKCWRQMVGSKVVLNMCGCILLQIILLYSNLNDTDLACAISGSMLHYSVLCGFSWSLIMAVLHYLKFVRVIGPQTSHLLLKAAVVGWVLPVFPVISATLYNYLTFGHYLPNIELLEVNICYPQGMVMYLSLLLPVTLIVCTNLGIFIIVLYKVGWRPKIRNTLDERQQFIQQIKLAVFLFFLLGLTWIFGLLAVLFPSMIVLIYFFSLTASLQGFVLFLFYVIFDKKTRTLWQKKLKTSRFNKTLLILSRETETTNTSKDEMETNMNWYIKKLHIRSRHPQELNIIDGK